MVWGQTRRGEILVRVQRKRGFFLSPGWGKASWKRLCLIRILGNRRAAFLSGGQTLKSANHSGDTGPSSVWGRVGPSAKVCAGTGVSEERQGVWAGPEGTGRSEQAVWP